jgi:hypothetical protein
MIHTGMVNVVYSTLIAATPTQVPLPNPEPEQIKPLLFMPKSPGSALGLFPKSPPAYDRLQTVDGTFAGSGRSMNVE